MSGYQNHEVLLSGGPHDGDITQVFVNTAGHTIEIPGPVRTEKYVLDGDGLAVWKGRA